MPALSQLAAQGLRYNRFHVSALCSSTRAALLSGRNDHNVGYGSAVEYGGYPGYNGIWPKSAVSIAEMLRRHGYSTSAFGKWHNTPSWEISPVGPFDRWPTSMGFEYFYGFMHHSDSQWEPALYRDTTPVNPPRSAEDGYQLTTDLADEAIRWLQTQESLAPHKPYLLYFAPGATHHPHQVSRDWVEQFRGQFDQGWDRLREVIYARQKSLGVIPKDALLTERPAELPAWSKLSRDEQRLFARQMEVYAGFLAQTDHEVGRVLSAVHRRSGGDNTLVLYIVGDNGASGDFGVSGSEGTGYSSISERLQHSEPLGGIQRMNDYSAGWAWALSTPFQWMKTIASHLGGIRDPLVVSWPARIKDHGGVRSQFTHVNDVAATLYEVIGIEMPAEVDGVKQQPLDGVSFAASFADAQAPSRHTTQIWEQLGHRAIYQDGWLAGARHSLPWEGWSEMNDTDYSKDRWELYHLERDYSQSKDLARKYPKKLRQLQQVFDEEAKRNNIYPLFGADSQGTPTLGGDRTQFVFYPGLPRLLSWVAPSFNQPHRITARVVIPEQGAEGILLSNGGRSKGFVLSVQNRRLVYELTQYGAVAQRLESREPLPSGPVELVYELSTDLASLAGEPARGHGRLYINGRVVAEDHSILVPPKLVHGAFEIGEARLSPVSNAYHQPFRFTGTLEKVTVDMAKPGQHQVQ